MVMAIAGGVLALISVGLRRTNVGKRSLNKLNNTINSEWLHARVADKTLVPYGIAIAIGAIAGFYGAFILP
jgi:Flp pilus assembly protein protease CpaA